MSKYIDLYEGSFNDSINEKIHPDNKPYIGYSIKDRKLAYTIYPNYLCLEPIDKNNQLALAKIGEYSSIQYSFDKSNWSDFPIDYTNPLNFMYITVDKPIYLRGNNPNGILNIGTSAGCKLIGVGKYNASGDVTTLLNIIGDVQDLTTYGESSLMCLFGLIPDSTSGLPISLPGIDIVDASRLILPATTLADYCYRSMFYNCTSLTTAPKLPATTLAEGCYEDMFDSCISLTIAPELPATTLAKKCYNNMFNRCTSLTVAPILPATELAEWCYDFMFTDCTSLTTAPKLPATTLVKGCYQNMFYDCTSLTIAPELPATELAVSCYNSMFENCTSLTIAPELPATTLAERCYSYMFYGCTNLNYIKCLIFNHSEEQTYEWVNGVASTGTFVKHPDSTWSTGVSGILRGWEVVDAEL